MTGSLPAAAFWTQIVRDHECTVKDLTALSHGKTANNPTSQGNPEEVVAWRKALRDLFSSCSWGEDVPVTTFPFRVQLTLLRNPCLFSHRLLPGSLESRENSRGTVSTAQWAQKPTRVRVGKEGSSTACREALQPLLGDVINSFWDVGRLV